MTWQSSVYFISIVLTCGLTGFLAFYAWRRPPLPEVRLFAALVFSECLLALTEIISMVSATPTQALFWFNVRFFFIAFIPLIWLSFALVYSGQKEWFSKNLLAGSLAIPLITQVMVWSNGLHGLWVTQEVTFHQNGPFWIVETSARIPGIWFMVHSIYSLLLLLIGIGVIFLTAWRRRQRYRGQALLLSLGALIALITAVISVFNLLPQTEFNLFIPGIGIAAVFYALAIFRSKFLDHSPIQESTSLFSTLEREEKRSLILFLLIFLLMVAGISATGYVSYENYEKQFRNQVEQQISAVAELKIEELESLRKGWQEDAIFLKQNKAFAELAQHALEDPTDIEAQEHLQAWLESIQTHQYNRVFLLDTQSIEHFTAPKTSEPSTEHLKQDAMKVLHSKQITFWDFHIDSDRGPIWLAMLVPILTGKDANQPVGVLVLLINPDTYLYPIVNRWHTTSNSAETLLVRRDGNDVLFLNNNKIEKDAALNLRIPLTKTDVPAVRAVLGQTGMTEGLDYRGISVVADIRAIPDTPWFLITKIDTNEVYAPLRERTWGMVVFFGALVITSGAGMGIMWRQQRLRYYQQQITIATALQKSEDRFHLMFEKHEAVMLLIEPQSGAIMDANHAAEKFYGYTKSALCGMSINDINTLSPDLVLAERQKALHEKRNFFVFSHRLANGEKRVVEVHSSPISFKEKPLLFSIIHDITERKQAEEKLRESETRFRIMVESVKDYAIILLDPGGNVVNWNIGAERIKGYQVSEITGQYFSRFYPPEDIASGKPEQELAIATTAGRFEDVGWRVRKDGSQFMADVVITALHDEAGQLRGFVKITRDITERKKALDALQESENRYRTLVQNMQVGIVVHSPDTKILFSNPMASQLLGLTFDQLLGKTAIDPTWCFIKEDGTRCPLEEYPVNQALATGTSISNLVLGIVRPDRERPTWAQCDAHQSWELNGNLQQIVVTFFDITERKQAEEALKTSEKKYRLLHESMIDGFVSVDMTGRFLECNEVYRNMLGYSEIELAELDYQNITPEKWWDYEKDIVENQIIKRGYSDVYEKEYRRKDGAIFPVELHTVLLRDEQGNPTGMWAIARDITERKRAENELKRSNTELEQFAYVASHDLQEPLRAVTGMVQLLQQRYQGQLDERADQYIALAVEAATRMQTLINDLLDFSRVERRGNPLETVAVESTLKVALANLGLAIRESQAQIIYDQLPTVKADASQLTQVFQNLIGNALKFHGEAPPQIHITAEQTAEGWNFAVRDNGIGIEPQYFERIFGVFQRLHTRRAYAGTGIGLSICKKIVERHGGRIWVDSQPGSGSTFHFTLPIGDNL